MLVYRPARTSRKPRPVHPCGRCAGGALPCRLTARSLLELLPASGLQLVVLPAATRTASCCCLLDITRRTIHGKLGGSGRATSSIGELPGAFRELTVAFHLTWCLLVRAGPRSWLAPDRVIRLAAHRKPAEASPTRLAHRVRKSSTQSRPTTNSGQHRSDTRFGTSWLGMRSSASQQSRGSRMPTTVALRSLLVPRSPLLRQVLPQCPFATALTLRRSGGHLSHRLRRPRQLSDRHPLSAAPQAAVLPCAAEAQNRSYYKRHEQLEVILWRRHAGVTRCRDASWSFQPMASNLSSAELSATTASSRSAQKRRQPLHLSLCLLLVQ